MSSIESLVELAEFVMDAPIAVADADTPLTELEGWDSVNALRFLTSIESEFDVRVPVKQYLGAQTLRDIHALVAPETEEVAP